MQETPTFVMVPLKGNFTHARVYWLVHMRVQTYVLLQVMEHSQVSLTVQVCYTKGCTHAYAAQVDTYVGTYTYATRVSPTCSRQSLRRIFSQGAYSSDIISSYSEWSSVVLKILTSHEMCKFSLLCSQKERWHLWMGCIHRQVCNTL